MIALLVMERDEDARALQELNRPRDGGARGTQRLHGPGDGHQGALWEALKELERRDGDPVLGQEAGAVGVDQCKEVRRSAARYERERSYHCSLRTQTFVAPLAANANVRKEAAVEPVDVTAPCVRPPRAGW